MYNVIFEQSLTTWKNDHKKTKLIVKPATSPSFHSEPKTRFSEIAVNDKNWYLIHL